MIRSALTAVLAFTAFASTSAQTKLPTVEEATKKSQQTGRPIFAMVGRET